MRAINAESVRALIHACEAVSVRRFVQVSTVGVRPAADTTPATRSATLIAPFRLIDVPFENAVGRKTGAASAGIANQVKAGARRADFCDRRNERAGTWGRATRTFRALLLGRDGSTNSVS